MAEVSIREGFLVVSIGWFETIRALRGSFSIPMAQVRGATEDSRYVAPKELGLRSPGTGFPGLVAEGTFRKNGEKVLSLWRRGQEVVVIELADARWNRLVVGCDDAKALADLINRTIRQ